MTAPTCPDATVTIYDGAGLQLLDPSQLLTRNGAFAVMLDEVLTSAQQMCSVCSFTGVGDDRYTGLLADDPEHG